MNLKLAIKHFSVIVFIFLTNTIFSQTLDVPPRPSGAMTGSQFTVAILPLSFTARENLIYNEFISGNIPNFYRNLSPVTSTAVISGSVQSVTYYVTPDYIAIGSDADYFLCPMSPMVATKITDSIGCTLPTRKMVNDIYAQAALKLPPLTIPASGTMTTVQAFAQHNNMVGAQRTSSITAYPLGTLVGGDKKDIVISNLIYSTANRVIIYGWHTSIGNPIQPMTNVHADTYMDYSHGMRFVQNAVIYNGSATTVKAILQSTTLNTLLSDEGVINPPEYPYGNPITTLSQPKSFAVINKTNNTLEIKVKNDANATHYKVYTSTNGTTFSAPATLLKSNLILSALTSNQLYYVKIEAYNATYSITSVTSEVLAAVPCNYQDSVLVVNGFDRATTGNTYNFVIQHAGSIKANNKNCSSATNEAVTDALINLNTYKAIDWILGKESTANETFSTNEQTLVSSYLQQGGKLLVSGSEIAWDLDYSGTVADKNFFANYLKASYVSDAPNNQASTWYKSVNEPSNSIFNFTDTIYFDNGTNGTYNVDYPDVIAPINGGVSTLQFTNLNTNKSGIYFSGLFPSGAIAGKLVYLTFPFETIYNTAKRTSLMNDILTFFFSTSITTDITDLNSNDISLYPNPTKNIITIASSIKPLKVELIDMNGKIILEYPSTETIDLTEFLEGIYFVKIYTSTNCIVKKVIKE
jgi:hypothetical protein